jgi:hypothetical protein
MNRKLMVFIVGLLALGALEFGLLGASASGIVGGSGHPLPPIGQRGNVEDATSTATVTPEFVPTASPPPPNPNPGCAISPPDASPPCSAIAASIELMRPDPSAIPCDGRSASIVRVFLRNSSGDPVDDGTPVLFSVFNGTPSPYYAVTHGGSASASIVIYSDAYSQQPNVVVTSGDLETAVRLRCIPNSDCPVSPPPDTSPPCGPTPFPCNPSPGADFNSPPCATPTPISPPACGLESPPCWPFSPPSAPSPPPPPPTTGSGGEIYIGTPYFVDGKIRVPVNTTASQDAFAGFNVQLAFSDELAVFSNSIDDFASGGALEASGLTTFCAVNDHALAGRGGGACTLLGRGGTKDPGTLAYVTLNPRATTGCIRIHLVTYGPPDIGGVILGTFTVSTDDIPAAQANTYGPDVYVNTADGTPCSPPPTPTPTPIRPLIPQGIGGEISIGTPELVAGRIRVPINTTDAVDAYRAFNVHLLWDGALASIIDIPTGATAGDAFGEAPLFCVRGQADQPTDLNGTSGLGFGCTALGAASTTAGGHLADFWLTSRAQGCLRLHIVPYDTSDTLATVTGTYTLNADAFVPEVNTYGPDVYVNTADGTPCTPPPDATPTPPGPDAQTATAISGLPQGATASSTPVPTATASPPATSEPHRTTTPRSAQRTPTPQPGACADVNGDGRVTPRDVTSIAAHVFGRYRAQFDLNHDHRVNQEDIRIAIRRLGHRC